MAGLRSAAVCLAVACLVTIATALETADADLVHVSVLFRHGHRSPVELLPSQNFTIANTWTDGLGQLTNIGKLNEYELGLFLRKRYDSLLGPRYNSSDHLVRSTDVDRTLMSAQACLAGLFPPLGDQVWNQALPWQPIPVHTRPQATDWLLAAPDYPCSARDSQFAAVRSDPTRLAFYAPHKDFLARLTAGAGMPVTPDTVHTVLDTLWINRVRGLPDPAWLNASGGDWDRLVTVGSYQWREYSWTDDLVRFGSGVLLNEILDTADDIASGRVPIKGRKLKIYSDHDTTVASTLAALGNRDFVWPNFAACLMFELRKDQAAGGNFTLRILFRNDTALSPIPIRLLDCPEFCPLARATQILAPMRLTVTQLIDRCQSGGHARFFWHWSDPIVTAALACCFMLAAVLAGVVVGKFCRARKRRSAVLYRSLADETDG